MKDKYGAVVKMVDSGDKLKLDQTHVETVIPAPGKPPEPSNDLRWKHLVPPLGFFSIILLSVFLSNFLQVNVF